MEAKLDANLAKMAEISASNQAQMRSTFYAHQGLATKQ
jgi:hypothetical protein